MHDARKVFPLPGPVLLIHHPVRLGCKLPGQNGLSGQGPTTTTTATTTTAAATGPHPQHARNAKPGLSYYYNHYNR